MQQLKKTILLTAVLIAILTSCSNEESNNNKNESIAASPKKEMVKIMELGREKISRSIEYSATLEPFEIVHLAPSTPGKIETINVEIGDKITKGQLLVKMDDAQLIQSQIQMSNLQNEFERLNTLKKTGSIAQQKFDQMETQFEVSKKNVEFLSDNTTIKAPFAGVISGKYFENGEIYSGAPIASVGKAAILTLIKIDELKTKVSISERYFPSIKKGMEATVKVDVYPGLKLKGKIIRIYPTINPQSHSFEVEISIPNYKNELRPGMFCRIFIDLQETEVLALPALAIIKMQGSNIRYIFVEKNGIAKRIEVTLGKRFDDKVEVISDELHPGDKVIISGQARLLKEMEVQVVN